MPFIKRTDSKNAYTSTDSRKIFIGRTNELHFFVEYILKPEDPSYNIVSVSGNGGVGKSTLLTRFIEEACSPAVRDYCLTALVDERQLTPASMMERFAQQLNEAGFPLTDFEKALSRYKEALRKLQVEKEESQDTSGLREKVDLVGTVAESVVPVGKLLHKGANIATALYLKEQRSRQLRKDAESLEDPLADLTQIFVEELNHLTDIQVTLNFNRTKRRQRVLLFFDTFEQLAAEAASWLLDYFLQANISSNIILIIAGRDSIERSTPDDPKRWLQYRDDGVVYLIDLDSFTEDETISYLTERGITDPDRISTIWRLSGGLPLYLSLLTFNLQGNVDPTADVVANFLRWIPKQEYIKRRLALNAALFSKSFDQDDLSAFTYLPESDNERTELYHWLIKLPFVRSNLQDGRYLYHELAQELFSRHLFQRSQKEYYATRRALIEHYKRLLERHEVEENTEAYSNSQWLDLSLASAYQLFLLSDESSHIYAAEQVLDTYEHAKQTDKIVKVLRELSLESNTNKSSSNTRHIAKHLLEYVEAEQASQGQELLEAANNLLEDLSQKPSSSPEMLARIYWRRSRAFRRLNDFESAIADCDHAIELDPNYHTVYDRRGSLYRELGEYRRAIADYDRALELDPKLTSAYINRGITYTLLREYQRAIADFNHAINLDPNKPQTFVSRGFAYLWLRDIEPAKADLLRCWELDRTNISIQWILEWSMMCQKRTDPERIDRLEAIARIDPQHYTAYVCRGVALWLSEYFEEAEVELEQAISLNPKEQDAYFWKGIVYAYSRQDLIAIEALQKAITGNLPPVLLTPLHWLKQDRPDFFEKDIVQLLTRYDI